MNGTVATMGIEENLALALRRGGRRTLKPGITGSESMYRDLLLKLGLGLEERLTSKVGLLSGGQRQALTLLMATLKSQSCFCWMNTLLPWILRRRRRFWSLPVKS